MHARYRVMFGTVLICLLALMASGCGDTNNISADGGRDVKVCVDNADCPEGRGERETGASSPGAPESSSPVETASEGGGETGGSSGMNSGNESGSRSGEVGAAPTKITLSGGNLPYGIKTHSDGCWSGACTWWSEDDVIIGGQTFSTGFIMNCTAGCGNDESGYFELKLSGKYSLLDATFGISGESPGGDRTESLAVRIVNEGTGKQLYSRVLERGKEYPLKGLDISGVPLLHIIFEGPLGSTYGAVGAPTIST